VIQYTKRNTHELVTTGAYAYASCNPRCCTLHVRSNLLRGADVAALVNDALATCPMTLVPQLE
jgi:hypothetical protein